MGMQQETLKEGLETTGFVIEATSHCRSGRMPRWSFLIRGTGGRFRHGMVGTDTHGKGLYLYPSPTGDLNMRTELIAPGLLALSDSLSRQQANDAIMKILDSVNWATALLAARPATPRFELYAVS